MAYTSTEWNNIHITDKNGGKHFNTSASPMSTMSEIRNLQKHLQQASKTPQLYKFIDVNTAVIMLNNEPYI